ncbi:MAG: hypothetical protein GY754_23875 [bacterium]|nr:hypothetical protein [bacterium]
MRVSFIEQHRKKAALMKLEESHLIDFDLLLRTYDLETVSEKIVEGTYMMNDFMRKDTIDRLLDFVYFKVQTGYVITPSMAYPSKRMMDVELEGKIIELINVHLIPEIVLRLLKLFTRNIHNADSNLYVANLIYSEEIITSVFETYKFFKRDIFISDPDKRIRNVKRIQQYLLHSDNKLSSPLDAAARLKYILEFFYMQLNVSHIYTPDDLRLSKPEE